MRAVSLLVERIVWFALSLAVGLLLLSPSTAFPKAKSDLVVTALTDPPATAVLGDSFTITATVTNQGSAAIGASLTKFFLLSTSGPTRKNLKGLQSISGLAPGASDGPDVTVAVYSDTAPGTYFLQACADGRGLIPEAVESNNCRTSVGSVTVLEQPDLVVTSLSDPPATAAQGEGFQVASTVKNVGVVSAGASNTRYFLVSTSSTARIDLNGTPDVQPLDPAQTSTDEASVTVRL